MLSVINMLCRPWVISAFVAAFAASICWLIALQSLDLSRAYPFTASSFIIIAVFSATVFGEPLGITKVVGILLVVMGLVLVAGS